MTAAPLLAVEALRVRYPVRGGLIGGITGHHDAVDGLDLELAQGEALGLVGESGCGKSTLGRTILALQKPLSGRVLLHGQDLFGLRPAALRRQRRHVQLVFQNPKTCFDPRRTVGASVRMGLDLQSMFDPAQRDDAVAAIFAKVGLRPEHRSRYPHELSGGQLQRIGLARALVLEPDLVVCDEPVSALDVSVQAQILNLIKDLQAEFRLAVLFISHDLAVIDFVADRVAVMYYGRIVETGPKRHLFAAPQHPYTKALLEAVPSLDLGRRTRRTITLGDPPDPARLPSGCRFRTRCSLAFDRCSIAEPALTEVSAGHSVACWAAGSSA